MPLDAGADRAAERLRDRLEASRRGYLAALFALADYASEALKDDDRAAVLVAMVEDARFRMRSDNLEAGDLMYGL